MSCGDCKHALVPSTVRNATWGKGFDDKHVCCALGPNGDGKYSGALLQNKTGECRWNPSRYETASPDWSAYQGPIFTYQQSP